MSLVFSFFVSGLLLKMTHAGRPFCERLSPFSDIHRKTIQKHPRCGFTMLSLGRRIRDVLPYVQSTVAGVGFCPTFQHLPNSFCIKLGPLEQTDHLWRDYFYQPWLFYHIISSSFTQQSSLTEQLHHQRCAV